MTMTFMLVWSSLTEKNILSSLSWNTLTGNLIKIVQFSNVHKLGTSYFGVRSVVPISESLRKEGFTVFKITILAKWQADVKGTFHDLYVCFRNLKPKHRMNLEHVGIRQLHCSHCGNHRTLGECQCHVPPENEDGNECVMVYSTRWFGDGKNRILCSGPPRNWSGAWAIRTGLYSQTVFASGGKQFEISTMTLFVTRQCNRTLSIV
jgi:hypothetical protein